MSVVAHPAELFSQVEDPVRSSRAIRADIDCNYGRWQIDVNLKVYFQRMIFAASPKNDAPYCCGVRAGEVRLEVPECELIECDGGDYLKTTIEKTYGKASGETDTDAPEFSIGFGGAKASGKVGSRSQKEEDSFGKKISYVVEEAVVEVIKHNTGANWLFSKPDGGNQSVEYLYKDFPFKLLMKGQRQHFKGKLEIKPGAFSIYDSNGGFVSNKFTVKSLLLAYIAGKSPSGSFCKEYLVEFQAQESA